MPRPKMNPDEVLKLELRITPPDGKPIVDWKLGDDFIQVIAAQEGGIDSDCKLHYHLYIETLRSRSWIIKWIYSIAHCNNGEQGNAVFFSRKPHEHTIGYVVKHGDIVCRHGCSDTFITEWLERSAQYVRDKDSAKQRSKRLEISFAKVVRDKIAAALVNDRSIRSPNGIIELVLNEYFTAGKVFPSRTQMENLIITLLHPYDAGIARAFYLKNWDSW